MLKLSKTLTFIAAILTAQAARADTFVVGQQWSPTNSWEITCQQAQADAAANGSPSVWGCFYIPAGQTLRECAGTLTVKTAGVEILVRINSGRPGLPYPFTTIWQGEMTQPGTVSFRSPDLYKTNGQPQDPYVTSPSAVWVEMSSYAPGITTPWSVSEINAVCSTQ